MESDDDTSPRWGNTFRRAGSVDDELELLAAPPPSVMQEVARAARRYEQLRAAGHHLHFELEEGRVRIELRDRRGKLVRHVPPAEVLALAGEQHPPTDGPRGVM